MAPRADDRFGGGCFVPVHQGGGRPRLSILMPAYMQADFVAGAVSSVLMQQDCPCEIIISDDASTDLTFEIARETVEEHVRESPLEHTVIMRRGVRRLFREHFALLADSASCDVVMMAHGDDVARPDRAARILQALAHENAPAAASSFDVIDAAGRVVEPAVPIATRLHAPTMDDVIAGPDWLIGSSMAWRRSALSVFPRLDSRAVPTGHDRIMGLRAWLAGGITVIDEPLFSRRSHPGNWSRHLVDRRRPEALEFGWALLTQFIAETMLDDVDTAVSAGLIDSRTAVQARGTLHDRCSQARCSVRTAYAALSCLGLAPVCVDEATFREANDAVSGLPSLKTAATAEHGQRRRAWVNRLGRLGPRRLMRRPSTPDEATVRY